MDKIYTVNSSLGGHIFYPLTKVQIQIIQFVLSEMP